MSAPLFLGLLAAVLALFVLWVWRKQEPRRPLTPVEIDRYCATIHARFPVPDHQDRAAWVARVRRFAENDDGRDIYMLNLLRYNETMAKGPAAAGSFTGTPHEANEIYEANAKPILMKSGLSQSTPFLRIVDRSTIPDQGRFQVLCDAYGAGAGEA